MHKNCVLCYEYIYMYEYSCCVAQTGSTLFYSGIENEMLIRPFSHRFKKPVCITH